MIKQEMKLPDEWRSWELTEYIGHGSYGKVYRAEKRQGELVSVSAIKVVDIPASGQEIDPMLIGRQPAAALHIYTDLVNEYIREIRYMESLKGITNIVSIEDYYIEHEEGELHWRIFIRMEYLDSLREYLIEHPMDEPEVIRLGMDLCTALRYCGQKQIIHRDIKPDNIFVSEAGDFKLGDFGIARKMSQAIEAGSSKGTQTYMAPEIYHGESYGATVDIYSIGILLYRLMNDFRVPFVAADRQILGYQDMKNALDRRMKGDPFPAPVYASEPFARVILKACAFRPEDRYQTAAEFYTALQKLQQADAPAPEQAAGVSFDLDQEIDLVAAGLKLSPKGIRSFKAKVLREYEKRTGRAELTEEDLRNKEAQDCLKQCIYKVYSAYASWAEKHNVTINRP